MAHSLTITYGVTTITLSNFRYTPRTPKTADDLTITETITLQITSIHATIEALNRAFQRARNYQKFNAGDQVYVNFQPDGYATAYRSEILDGSITHDDETLGYQWLNQQIRAVVSITRRAWWEGEETALDMLRTNESGATIPIHNCNDNANLGGDPLNIRQNFVEIAGEDIQGDLPAPIRVAMTNTLGGGADATLDIWIGQHVHGEAGALFHQLEFETANLQGGHGAEVADATASDGQYMALDWTGAAETLLGQWTLASIGANTWLNAFAGETLHALMRTTGIPAIPDIWLKWVITDSVTLTPLWSGSWTKVNTTDALQEVGVVRFPPRKIMTYFGTTSINLNLYGKCADVSVHVHHLLNVDFFQFWARVRRLRSGGSVPTDDVLYDDQIENIRVLTDTSADISSISAQVPLAGPILLEPAVTQRLYFLQIDTDHEAAINRTLDVSVWYRPRRVTL